MQQPRLNETANSLVERMIERAELLRVHVHDDGVNVPVIDCGIKAAGSVQAGLTLAEVCLAGLAKVSLVAGDRSIWPGSAIQVQTDQPLLACMASQYGGWHVKGDDFFAIGSGPMRASAGQEELFEKIGGRESAAVAVGALETRQFPSPALCKRLASDCAVEHRKLTLLVAPTASIAGNVQVVARSVETAMHKLLELGFDIAKVRSGWGVAPLPPVAGFASCDHDFYKMDPLLFSPAWVRVNNLSSGRSFSAGEVMPEVLQSSFGSISVV